MTALQMVTAVVFWAGSLRLQSAAHGPRLALQSCRTQHSSSDKITLSPVGGGKSCLCVMAVPEFRVCRSLVKDQVGTETVHESHLHPFPAWLQTDNSGKKGITAEISSQCQIQTRLWWLAADQPCSQKSIGELPFELRQGRKGGRGEVPTGKLLLTTTEHYCAVE